MSHLDRALRPRRLALLTVLVSLCFLVVACSDVDDAGRTTPASTPPNSDVTPPTGLTTYDSSSALLVAGRERFLACVEVIDESLATDQAVSLLHEALVAASADPRWHATFNEPAALPGCPMEPLALATGEPAPDRIACSDQASAFVAHVYVGDAILFEERFPEELVRVSFPVPGIRRAPHEYLVDGNRGCAGVSEAWYVTADELSNPELISNYVFGFFPIAEIGP